MGRDFRCTVIPADDGALIQGFRQPDPLRLPANLYPEIDSEYIIGSLGDQVLKDILSAIFVIPEPVARPLKYYINNV